MTYGSPVSRGMQGGELKDHFQMDKTIDSTLCHPRDVSLGYCQCQKNVTYNWTVSFDNCKL